MNAKLLDKISNELFNKHSLAALILTIKVGDELDFHYGDEAYSITWLKEELLLSSPEIEGVQKFKNCEELIINGIIDGKKFIDVWDKIILDYLF